MVYKLDIVLVPWSILNQDTFCPVAVNDYPLRLFAYLMTWIVLVVYDKAIII